MTVAEPLGSPPSQAEHLTSIALLDRDPDLAHGIPHGELPLARRTLVVPGVALERGPVDVGALGLPPDTFALLVMEGELTSDVALEGRSLTEILVAGDVETPWDPDVEGLPVTRRIVATTPARIAALDARFLLAAGRWPSLMAVVQRRMAAQKQRLAVHCAICQLPRVGDRLLAMLHHVAERTGRVTADGTLVPVRLTHESLGRLVGARRPTVSLAMKDLADAGHVRRLPDGTWLLKTERPDTAASLRRGG